MNTTPPERKARETAAWIHASFLVSAIGALFIGTNILGVLAFVGPFVAYYFWRRKRLTDEWLAVQSLQVLFYQIAVLLYTGGFFFPRNIINLSLLLAAVLYATWAALRTYRGASFKYIVFGGLAESIQQRTTRRP